MKKFLSIIYFLIFVKASTAQNYQYAFITDLHIGAPNADNDLRLVINDINKREEIKFVIAGGDISEKGRNQELQNAKQILDELKVNYYIIPGNHDTKWSESGCTKFIELWGDDKFHFSFQEVKHIGVNSGIPWRGGGGHVSVEQLNWLKNILSETNNKQEIIFYIHHPLDGDVDNWFEVTNLLAKHNVKAIFYGHGHTNQLSNFAGIPAAMGRSTLSRPKYPGYTIIELKQDSINLYEAKVDSIPNLWGSILRNKKNEILTIDSLQFIQYSNKANILWKKNLNKTFSTSLLINNERIFSSSISGEISCFNLRGELIWQDNLDKTIFSRPAAADNTLAVATVEGDLYTINTANGEVIQVLGLAEPLTSQAVITDIEFYGKPVSAVIIATSTGKVFCYELNNLEFIWENNSASAMIETLPLIVQNKVIFGSWDNYVYCLSKQTGSLIWKWTENKNFYYSPAACWAVSDDKNIFIATPDKFVSAVDLNLGTTTWRKNDFNAWESIGLSNNKKRIFVKSLIDKLFIASAVDGKLIKEIKIGYGLDTMPIQITEWNENIIFGSKNGIIYLIDKNYNVSPLFFLGTARIHTIQHVKENIFAASNMDGKIVLFSINADAK